jgi:hypothetical protein
LPAQIALKAWSRWRRSLGAALPLAVVAASLLVLSAAPASAADRTAVTSYDRMAAGAPFHGYFVSAWQGFIAQSDTITTVGVTVGTPGYVADGHTITINLCTDPACGTVLASASPQIVNYGDTQADFGDIGVTPGTLYYLVWYQPAEWNNQTWVTYWWSGGSTISSSDQMQALVQGYDRGPQVDRTAVTSYNRMQAGAPYNGYFVTAWQAFTAQSNTITTLGVTVGSPGYAGTAAWTGAWVAGIALIVAVGVVAGLGSEAPGVGWVVLELPVIAAWLTLGAWVSRILAAPGRAAATAGKAG